MLEDRVNEIISSSLREIKSFTNADSVIGNAILTPSGVTVIPISKISIGFAGGGVDFGMKKSGSNQNFGTGSGTGISITPIAFLTVNKDATVNLIHVNPGADSGIERISALIEHSPEILQKLKNAIK